MLQLIKAYLNSKEDLVIIKFFLQRYIIILNSKFNNLFNDNRINDYNSIINLMNIEPKNSTLSNYIILNKEKGNSLDHYNPKIYRNINQRFINPYHTNPHFTSANNNNNQGLIILNYTNPHFISANNQINNNEIEIVFKYKDYFELYSEKAKMNEKLGNVIERFKNKRKENNINLFTNPTYNGKRIDPQHTLYELGIKNSNSLIVFEGLSSDKFNKTNNTKVFTFNSKEYYISMI